jgi:two-component system, LytTR family, sensor kinase
VIIWVLLIGPHSFFSAYLIDDHPELLLYCVAVADGLLILIIYFIIYVLIRGYYQQRKYTQFLLWLISLFAVYTLACVKMEMDISVVLKRESNNFRYAVYYFINISRYTVIGFLLFWLSQAIRQSKKLDQITMEKLQAEVNYLRAQINPHFLFNTLNNLYGLSLEKSGKTPELIIRLSKMMDYMLYEVEGTKVLLKRDLENLENYIEMERVRQGNSAVIHYTVKGDISNQLIEPLLMLPLVENAFKHGVNQMIGGAYLEVTLSVSPDVLIFTVKNNYKPRNNDQQIHKSLGLINLKKRLDLFYANRYALDIYDDAVNYHVKLTLHSPFSTNESKTTEFKIDKDEPVNKTS